MIIIYTTGVFDLLHIGHIKILKRARALGDKLTVGVQDDDSVEEQKGERPILNSNERMAMLEALHIVDNTICYTNTDQLDMLDLIKPNIMVQGSDWEESSDRTTIKKYLNDNNIELVHFPYTKNLSTTEIKDRMYKNFKKDNK